jgi:hypothetical protein
MSETTLSPATLSLADQLDAMLLGWLERRNAGAAQQPTGGDATAVITVAAAAVPGVEALCARWGLGVHRPGRGEGPWIVLCVSGRPLPIMGLAEIIRALRRRDP